MTVRNSGVALTPTSDAVIPLISYSITDWMVTGDEKRQVLDLFRADTDYRQLLLI